MSTVIVNADNLGLGSKLGKLSCTNGQRNKSSKGNVNVKRLKLSKPTTDNNVALGEESFTLETDNSNEPTETLIRKNYQQQFLWQIQ